MNVTLTLDDRLVKEIRKIAAERETTLAALVREYLEGLTNEQANSDLKRRQLEALERSFRAIEINYGERTWKREDLYERPRHARTNDGSNK